MKVDTYNAHARQFKRHASNFQARIEPHADHAEQFRLTFPDGKAGLGVSDVSKGGMGLIAGIFVPRNMRLQIHIEPNEKTGNRPFVVRVVTRRCSLLDHKPTYQIGLQFLDVTGADEQALVKAALGAEAAEAADAKAVDRGP
jgi:PilZ domain